MPDHLSIYVAALVAEWLSERTGRAYRLDRAVDGDARVCIAAADGATAALAVGVLWDTQADPAAEEARQMMAGRLSAGNVRGPHILWVPPSAAIPADEPAASDFVQRVQFAAAALQPGGRAEVELPVKLQLAKMRDEGGYASVTGGLSRWWTLITERVSGTFHVNSQSMHRAPASEEKRAALFEHIGQMSRGLQTGQATEFETVEAWTVQKLREEPLGETGFAIAQAPPRIDPSEGALQRRLVRQRLRDANAALDALDADAKGVALVGIFEYAESENIGSFVKSLDPGLYARLQFVCAVVDGAVRPIFAPRGM
jgi:hypothetical protein